MLRDQRNGTFDRVGIRSSGVVDRGPDFHGIRVDIGSDFVEESDEVLTGVREEQIMARTHRGNRQLRMKASGLESEFHGISLNQDESVAHSHNVNPSTCQLTLNDPQCCYLRRHERVEFDSRQREREEWVECCF